MGRSIALRPFVQLNSIDQKLNAAWKKMRRAAELVGDEKMPRARLVDLSNRLPGPYNPVLVSRVGIRTADGCP